MDFPAFFDAFYYGQDFGYNHADAILGVGWKDGEVYICSEIYVFEKDTEEIMSMNRFVLYVEWWARTSGSALSKYRPLIQCVALTGLNVIVIWEPRQYLRRITGGNIQNVRPLC